MPATASEQRFLERINSARLDPLGNAARYISDYAPLTSGNSDIQSALNYFGVNGSLLLQQFSALVPVQPLAFNDALAAAARNPNLAMIDADTYVMSYKGIFDGSCTGPDGKAEKMATLKMIKK